MSRDQNGCAGLTIGVNLFIFLSADNGRYAFDSKDTDRQQQYQCKQVNEEMRGDRNRGKQMSHRLSHRFAHVEKNQG